MRVTLISLRLVGDESIYLGTIWIICLGERYFFNWVGNVDPKITLKFENNENMPFTLRLKYTFGKLE